MLTIRRVARTTVLSLASLLAACSSPVGEPSASLSSATTGAPSVDADAATSALLDRFWTGSYFADADPPTSGPCGTAACYWIFAETFDAVLDAVQRTSARSFSHWPDRLYAAQEARGWIEPQSSKYFDDESWMGLALVRAYDVTRDSKYLCRAVELYRDIKSEGFDTAGGTFSGIWWSSAHTTKVTASNFGPAILAARLAERPAVSSCSSAKAGYVDPTTAGNDARRIYDHWLSTMTRIVPDGTLEVADHRSKACGGGVCWEDFTYNQGVGIGAALELQHVTGDGRYVIVAQQMADYMIEHLATAAGVLRDPGACTGDCAMFKGIGYRFLMKLYELDPTQTRYGDVLRASAVAIWGSARDVRTDTFATGWDGPAGSRTSLAADASAVMALNLAVEWGIAVEGSSPSPPPPPPPSAPCGELAAGDVLAPGASITSCNGRYRLVVQAHDGNLVMYEGSSALWASGTTGHGGDRLSMQGDGNLVLYGGNSPLWYTATDGHPGAHLVVQDDANVVVYAGSTPVWARFGMPTQTCYARCCDGTLQSVETSSSAACRGEFELCGDHGHGAVKHMVWDGQNVYGPITCP